MWIGSLNGLPRGYSRHRKDIETFENKLCDFHLGSKQYFTLAHNMEVSENSK